MANFNPLGLLGILPGDEATQQAFAPSTDPNADALIQQLFAQPQSTEVAAEPIDRRRQVFNAIADALTTLGRGKNPNIRPSNFTQNARRLEEFRRREKQQRADRTAEREADTTRGKAGIERDRRLRAEARLQGQQDRAADIELDDKRFAEQLEREDEVKRESFVSDAAAGGFLGSLTPEQIGTMSMDEIRAEVNKNAAAARAKRGEPKLDARGRREDLGIARAAFADVVRGGGPRNLTSLADRLASGEDPEKIIDDFDLDLGTLGDLEPGDIIEIKADLRRRIRDIQDAAPPPPPPGPGGFQGQVSGTGNVIGTQTGAFENLGPAADELIRTLGAAQSQGLLRR